MFNLTATPYSLDAAAEAQVRQRVSDIEERVRLLRRAGTLTDITLRDFYGQKRFEEVAESNALEGSTLSAGETQLAVMKGITITGHDPAYVKDAIALNKALDRITELAKNRDVPTDIDQVRQVNELILGDRPGAGLLRKEAVIISGSSHRPPATWDGVMRGMEEWERWSKANKDLPAPIRAAILHAWLTHIHPYLDGNGRAARAISNLELIRAGYPPIIIKKKERDRYIDALAESDVGGDIRSFMELVFARIEGSLRGLELAAKAKQGYDQLAQKIRERQEALLKVWDTSVRLLASSIELHLSQMVDSVGGRCSVRIYDTPLDIEDFIDVCEGRPASHSWAFTVRLEVPGLPRVEHLAWIGFRGPQMKARLNNEGGPSVYWSHRNPVGYPKWLADKNNSPFAVEMTQNIGKGDAWTVMKANGDIVHPQLNDLSRQIAEAIAAEASLRDGS
ncbi:Fic family protein [Lysobacter sp. CA196]|uniref:Fic family protein n=1 Tax=Lysobacter sp. CA196 TaxID=3455606 RepID=UPI003F8D5263